MGKSQCQDGQLVRRAGWPRMSDSPRDSLPTDDGANVVGAGAEGENVVPRIDAIKAAEQQPAGSEITCPPSPAGETLAMSGRQMPQEPKKQDSFSSVVPDNLTPHLQHLNPWEEEDVGEVGDFTKEYTDKQTSEEFTAGALGRERANSTDGEDYSVDNAITQIGWGRFQLKLLIIVAMSKGFIGMQMLAHAYNQHVLKEHWDLSKTETTLMGSALFLGMLLGAIFWGRMSDAFGRRRVFLLTIFNTFLFGSISAAAPSYGAYVVCRVLLGFGIGGQGPVSIALLLEFTPSHCRGFASGLVWVGWYLGEALETLIGFLFHWGQDSYWQQVAVWTSLPPLLLLMAWGLKIVHIPESPRYLLVSGKQRRGWETLELAAMENKAVMYRHKLVGLTTSKNWISCVQEDRKASFMGLFTPTLLRTTLLLWWIWFVAGYGTYGLMFILPKFFSRKTSQSLTNEHLSMLLTSCGAMMGVLVGSWTSENWGRRPTFAMGFLGAGVSMLLLNSDSELEVVLLLAGTCRFFNGVYEAVWYTYTPEVYPTTIRSLGVGMCSAWAKVAGIASPFVANLLLTCSEGEGRTGCGATLRTTIVSAVAFLLASIAAVALPIETMGCALQDFADDTAKPRAADTKSKRRGSHPRLHEEHGLLDDDLDNNPINITDSPDGFK